MNPPPIAPDGVENSPYLKIVYQTAGQFIGRVWTIVSETPHFLYQLLLSIKELVKKCLFPSEPKEKQHDGSKLSPSASKKGNNHEEKDPLGSLELDALYSGFDPKLQSNKLSPLLNPNHIENVLQDPLIEENDGLYFDGDPLDDMGAINSKLSPVSLSSINEISQNIELGGGEIKDKILGCITDTLDSVKNLIEEIENKKSMSWKKCLDLIERMDLELEKLKIHASKVIGIPDESSFAQEAMKKLETKRAEIEKVLCKQIQSHYVPNPAILEDGHCLFSSIDDLLKINKKPIYYRKLAVEYIRNHTDKFESAVKDVIKLPLIRATMENYTESQGGLQSCCDKLEQKLRRSLTAIDFYCDCLENTNLWGGNTEVLALSEQLQVQILIFTQQKNSTWRFDLREGGGKFKQKTPLLLYYNGINHYQSLIPRFS